MASSSAITLSRLTGPGAATSKTSTGSQLTGEKITLRASSGVKVVIGTPARDGDTMRFLVLLLLPVSVAAQTTQTNCDSTSPSSISCTTWSAPQIQVPPSQAHTNPGAFQQGFERSLESARRAREAEALRLQQDNLALQNELLRKELEERQRREDERFEREVSAARTAYREAFAKKLSPEETRAEALRVAAQILGYPPSDSAMGTAAVQCLFGC